MLTGTDKRENKWYNNIYTHEIKVKTKTNILARGYTKLNTYPENKLIGQ